MSTTVSRIVSLEEYLEFEAPDGTKDELIEGEIVISPSPTAGHALIVKSLLILLHEVLKGSAFEFSSDLSIIVDPASPPSMPRPDVFVMNRERLLDAARRNVYPVGSPELAIEVVSPGNTKRELLKKLSLYLRHGSCAVWIVYPKTHTVMVWDSPQTSCEYREGERIALPAPLPERPVAVSDIFSVLP
jgi:Uma2 family endonuclease